MNSKPVAGMVLGTFDTTIPDDFVGRLDAILGGAARPVDDDARAVAGAAPPVGRTAVPPGAFVFFCFLPDMSWMERAGVSFDRSLAMRRRLRIHGDVYPGDRLTGCCVVASVDDDRKGRPRRFVTIATDYRLDDRLVLNEAVTYLTQLA